MSDRHPNAKLLTLTGMLRLGAALVKAEVSSPAKYRAARALVGPKRRLKEIKIGVAAQAKRGKIRSASRARLLAVVEPIRELRIVGEFDGHGELFRQQDGCSCPPTEGLEFAGDDAQAKERSRSRITLCCDGTDLFVRKQYIGRGARSRLEREVRALYALRDASICVPALRDVDYQTVSLVVEYVGVSIESELRKRGIGLWGRELRKIAGGAISDTELEELYHSVGSRAVSEHMPDLVPQMAELVEGLHRRGVTVRSVTYGNFVIDREQRLWAIDFEAASVHKNKHSVWCLLDRDRDTQSLRAAFGIDGLTWERCREKISEFQHLSDVYAPTYVGWGLRLGNIRNPSSGFGKWHFLVRAATKRLLADSSILSLGTNNCSIELEMLRAGARTVVAYERNPEAVEQAEFLHSAVEWAENRVLDLRIRQSSMVDCLNSDTNYDIALALCSLYYLPAGDMHEVADHMVATAKATILQANTGTAIGRETDEDYERASLGYAVGLLSGREGMVVEAYEPTRYSRPIAIGINDATLGSRSR